MNWGTAISPCQHVRKQDDNQCFEQVFPTSKIIIFYFFIQTLNKCSSIDKDRPFQSISTIRGPSTGRGRQQIKKLIQISIKFINSEELLKFLINLFPVVSAYSQFLSPLYNSPAVVNCRNESRYTIYAFYSFKTFTLTHPVISTNYYVYRTRIMYPCGQNRSAENPFDEGHLIILKTYKRD